MLTFAEALRDRHRTLMETVGRGELPAVDDLERQDADWNEMIEWLSVQDEKLEETADMLSHRINNLLMAVQTTCDFLATTENEGLHRLRDRMCATVVSGKSALEEVRTLLFNLR
jgi:hypothetical protein